MIFEVGLNKEQNEIRFETLNYMDINSFSKSVGMNGSNEGNEKHLEEILSDMIGETIFQDYLVFGRERNYQKEADIYAINEDGDLVIFELKVNGHYDRSKVLQVMDYAALHSKWNYKKINEFYKKSLTSEREFCDVFSEKFPERVQEEKFNRRQKMIIISNSSDKRISSAITYWKNQGIDIEEYFYRFYEVDGKYLFEITTDNFATPDSQNCWINTNITYDPTAYRDMVEKEKASAYWDRSNVITDSMGNGYIFLYHNGYGIIAAGKATKKINILEDQKTGEIKEKNIELKNFIHGCDVNNDYKIIKSINPAELKMELEQDFYFASTKVALDKVKAKKLYELCKKKFG